MSDVRSFLAEAVLAAMEVATNYGVTPEQSIKSLAGIIGIAIGKADKSVELAEEVYEIINLGIATAKEARPPAPSSEPN